MPERMPYFQLLDLYAFMKNNIENRCRDARAASFSINPALVLEIKAGIVDMKKAEKITKIGLNAHIDANQGFTAFRLEGSTDGVDFSDIGGGGQKVFSPGTKEEQLFGVTSPVAIRYVKITLLVGSPYPCLANFEAYARK